MTKKIYQVTLDKPLTYNDEETILGGITLEDGDVKVDDMQVLSKDRTILGLEIHIGRNRIVRRIFSHFGYEVVALDRVMYAGLDKKDLKRHIQMVFQDPYASLNPRMKIGEILEEGLLIHGLGDKTSREKKVRDMIKKVGLSVSDLTKYPHQFSGGQRQRIGIARALIVDPELVICDEPVSALDVSIQAQILLLLKELQKELGLSYLFISHDLRVVRHMADHIVVMHQGKIVEQGSVKSIYEKPKAHYTRELLNAIPGNHFKFKVS